MLISFCWHFPFPFRVCPFPCGTFTFFLVYAVHLITNDTQRAQDAHTHTHAHTTMAIFTKIVFSKVKKQEINRTKRRAFKCEQFNLRIHSVKWKWNGKRNILFSLLFPKLEETQHQFWLTTTKTTTTAMNMNTFRNGKMRPFGLNAISLLHECCDRNVDSRLFFIHSHSSAVPIDHSRAHGAAVCVCVRRHVLHCHRDTLCLRFVGEAELVHRMRAKKRRMKIDIQRMYGTHRHTRTHKSAVCSGVLSFIPGYIVPNKDISLLAVISYKSENGTVWRLIRMYVYSFHFIFLFVQMMTLYCGHTHTQTQIAPHMNGILHTRIAHSLALISFIADMTAVFIQIKKCEMNPNKHKQKQKRKENKFQMDMYSSFHRTRGKRAEWGMSGRVHVHINWQ